MKANTSHYLTRLAALLLATPLVALAAPTVYVDATFTGSVGAPIVDADPVTPGAQPATIGTDAFATIAAGVAAVDSGGTVVVNPGSYATGANLNKSLTLRGAQAGVDARSGRPGATETVITGGGLGIFTLSAVGITFDGFKFSNLKGRTIDTYFDADNFTMRNCILQCASIDPGYNTGAIQFGGGLNLHANGLLFEQNLVTADNGQLFYMGHSMDNGTIQNNTFHGDSVSFGPFGARTGWLIEGNEFNGDVPGHGPYWGFGFNANLGDVIIRNNSVTKMSVGVGQISVVGGSITGNTFDDNSFAAFQLWGGEFGTVVSANVLIQNNTIKYNGTTSTGFADASHGIRLRTNNVPAAGIDTATIHLHYNAFTDLGVGASGNAWSIRNNGNPATTADAEFNWWGSVRGPTTASNPGGDGAAFNGNVDFSPWLGDGTDTSPAILGFQPNPTPLYYTPTTLVFTTQPGGALHGAPLSPQPEVTVVNEIGGVATQFVDPVWLAIGTNYGGTLSGTTNATAVAGVASFSGLSIDHGGAAYTLVASADGLISAPSTPFLVNTPPVLSLPASPVIAEVTSPSFALVSFTVTASDAEDGILTPTSNHASGSPFVFGDTPVHVSVTDSGGLTATGSFIVRVQDTTPPVVAAHANVSVEATSVAGAAVTYAAATVSDNLGATSLTYSQASGTVFPLGVTTVTVTAKDGSNNTGTGTFIVTVQDTTAPVITLSGAAVVEVHIQGAFVDPGATASDAVDGSVPVSLSGSVNTAVLGTYILHYNAQDLLGHAAIEKTRTVNVTNHAPVAVADTASTDSTAVTLDVLSNDTDVDHDTLTLTAVTQPASGGVVNITAGKVMFTPTTAVTGTIVFHYTVSDGAATAMGTVTIQRLSAAAGISRGQYQGLIYGPDAMIRGKIVVTAGVGGASTGSLRIDGATYTFKGKLAANALFSVSTGSRTPRVPLTLTPGSADSNGSLVIQASLPDTAPGETLTGTLERSPYESATNPAPQAGRYTLVANPIIGGSGPATGAALVCNITKAGAVTFGGKTGLGVTVTQGGSLLSAGRFPFYVGSGSGSHVQRLAGEAEFDRTVTPQVSGTLRWTVPVGASVRLALPSGQDYAVLGAIYMPVVNGADMFMPRTLQATLSLEIPSLASTQTSVIGMNGRPDRTVQHVSFPDAHRGGARVDLVPGTGFFSGYKFVTAGRACSFFGVVLQDNGLNYGQGCLLDTSAVGAVSLTPVP